MNYFLGDTHFGHVNALSFDNRPFTNIEEHDAELIKRWNEVVCPDDDVYILGDLSWYNPTKTLEIVKMLNGVKHWILGNHDKKLVKNRELCAEFVEITDYKELFLSNGQMIVLCHYPIPCFRNHFYGAYMLYAHVHSSFEYNMMENIKRQMTELYDKPCNMFNTGAMMSYMNYTPRTLEEIINGSKFET